MHHGVLYASLPPHLPSPPPPLLHQPYQLSPLPSPSPVDDGSAGTSSILVSVFLALLLPCAGMSLVFMVYICLLWHSSRHNSDPNSSSPVKPVIEKGLTALELEKMPKFTGKELVMGTECAVCLDEIDEEQPARVVPGCNHGFHLQCADTWLLKHSVCPVCRKKLEISASSDNSDHSSNHENRC